MNPLTLAEPADHFVAHTGYCTAHQHGEHAYRALEAQFKAIKDAYRIHSTAGKNTDRVEGAPARRLLRQIQEALDARSGLGHPRVERVWKAGEGAMDVRLAMTEGAVHLHVVPSASGRLHFRPSDRPSTERAIQVCELLNDATLGS